MEDDKNKGNTAGADDANDKEEATDNSKYAGLNEDQEATSKILTKEGKDISEFLKMSHIKAADQTWDQLGLQTELKNNLIAKGFKGPSKIQFQVGHLLQTLREKNAMTDIVAQSQNGSGKTLSFLIPCLSLCTQDHTGGEDKMAPQAVILGDTNELVNQIYKIILSIKQSWLKAFCFSKDRPDDKDVQCHILISTVDSFQTMLNKKKAITTNLKILIIDEADKVIQSDGGKKNLPAILKVVGPKVLVGLFSATLPEKAIHILEGLKRDYNRIVVENKADLSLKNLKHFWVKCDRKNKFSFINKFLRKVSTGSVIMFVNSKKFADMFARRLHEEGHKTEILLGDMEIEDRMKILDDFKSGKIKVLLTTNLLSRGIDARKVSLVVNLDMPYTMKSKFVQGEDNRESIDKETYLHRCGRTARFGDMGVALNIVEDDRGERDLKEIEKEYGIQMNEITMDNFDEVIEKNIENNTINEEKRKVHEENI
jgi:ATP-dependent RNA helicase DDX19/DBP5